jgi:fructokinase
MTRHSHPSRVVSPTVAGTGLLALDIVFNAESHDHLECYAGGTCGNVLAILSYLGWKSLPVSRLAADSAANHILEDLHQWKVSTDFVSLESDGSTPIIIQRIGRRASGQPYHSFSWRCPICGGYLPGYKPVLAGVAQEVAKRLPALQVFFFDRVSRGSLHLAKKLAESGSIVFFEPSGIGDPALFREAWSLSHVIKYSHERLRDIADLDLRPTERQGVLLEIETLGEDGLRYRSRLARSRNKTWTNVPAFPVADLKDAAGSGDWCTAGLLSKLARTGLAGLRKTTSAALNEALRYGQALAAWNCGFEGARGGMYEVDLATFHDQVEQILEGEEFAPLALDRQNPELADLLANLCPGCEKSTSPLQVHRRNGTTG